MANLRANNVTGTGGRNAIKGSVYFGGYVEGSSSDYLYLQDSDDLDMGTGDFTFECWVNAISHVGTNSPNFMGIFSSAAFTAGGFLIQVNNTGPLRLVIPLAAGGNFEQSAGSLLWGSWNHIAVVKTSNTIKGFVNGVEVISASHTVGIDFAHGGYGTVGENCHSSYPGDYPLRGYISNLRLVKGTALYTSGFTPSTEELTAVDGTVLLCCQDSENPTQEATGREIIGYGACYYGKRYSNIATNGDLETGDTTGWTNSGCATFEASTNVVHSGTYSLHCVSDGNGDLAYTTATLDTNLRYKISAYINCVGPGGTSAAAKMKIGNGAGGNDNYESQTADAGAGWQYVEWIGKATLATTTITFNESSGNNVNDWYVDDLRVELWYPEEDQNILANPNFLTGATGWSFSSTPSGEYTISSNRLNVADTSRTSDAYATQQLFQWSMKEGRYRIAIDYALSAGGFDVGIGNNRIWTISGTSSNTYELNAGSTNSSFRIITNQHGAGYYNSVNLYRIAEPKRNNPIPPVGVDEGVTFGGDTKHNTQGHMYFPTGDTSQRGRGRAVFAGGYKTPGAVSNIDHLLIQSGGLTETFGYLSSSQLGCSASCSSETRMLTAGGYTGSANNNAMEYITIATTSNSTDFGDLAVGRRNFNAASNGQRGLFYGGNGTPADSTQVDYVNVANKGNAADFGDASQVMIQSFATASNTRALFGGGYAPGGSGVNTIEYFTIASTGNYTNFGDLTAARQGTSGLNSSTRSVFGGGGYPTAVNTIDYVTTATTGNAADFGDLTQARALAGGTSNGTRGVFMGGTTNPARQKTIDSIEIATLGNAVNWGEFRIERQNGGAASDSHGGL